MGINRRQLIKGIGAGLSLLLFGDWAVAQRVPDDYGLDPFASQEDLQQDEAYLESFDWASDDRFIDLLET